MTRKTTLTLVLVVLAATACGADPDPVTTASPASTSAPPTSAPPLTPSAPVTSTGVPVSTTSTTAAATLSASSRLRIDGLGPVTVGMTVTQARAAAGTELTLKKEPHCDSLVPARGPDGVTFVVTDPPSGRLDVVIVNGGPVTTLSGIKVGSTEAEVLAAYPGRIRSVNPSLPVHRLVYEAVDPALADRALAFFIQDKRVVAMYAGSRRHVEADEICA